MKLLITGDWHLDEERPANRTDNWFSTLIEKMTWIFDLAKDEKVDAILQPGDFFNSFKVSHYLIRYWIQFFKRYNIHILTVPGQHDMRYHSSDISNTPMGILEAAGVIRVLDNKPTLLKPGVSVYGAGWKQETPKGLQSDLNILVTHRLVADEHFGGGTVVYDTPHHLLETTTYDLIVCGDNHKSFNYQAEPRTVVNCGSLMRSAIDQGNHIPVVYIYNPDEDEAYRHEIPIKPFTEVMAMEKVEAEKEKNEQLESFVEGLSDTNIEGLDFKKALIDHLEKNKGKIGQGVIDVINKVVGFE